MDRWNELADFYNGKKILITGHTGFKGAWITKILVMSFPFKTTFPPSGIICPFKTFKRSV